MLKYYTKIFNLQELNAGKLDEWANGFSDANEDRVSAYYNYRIIGYQTVGQNYLAATMEVWDSRNKKPQGK